MKKRLFNYTAMGLALLAFTACETNNLEDINPANNNNSISGTTCDMVNFEDAATGRFISEVYSKNGMGPIMIKNRARNESGVLEMENRAMLFDTQAPTGDDEDLYTTDWGNSLIIQQLGVDNEPNDNQWGGQMMLTFPEAVTLKSVKVLDVDEYEDNSWIYLYDGNDNELYKVKLQAIGDNSKQTANLGNTAGVRKMKLVLAGTTGYVGSAAIDDLMFCAPPTMIGCTRTQGYWKNHADASKKKYNKIWDTYIDKTFFGSGMTYLAVLNKAPKGDAYFILAHQFIAAELNVAAHASIPDDVRNAWLASKEYFEGKTTPPREDLIKWAELLDKYNNGIVGPGHCD